MANSPHFEHIRKLFHDVLGPHVESGEVFLKITDASENRLRVEYGMKEGLAEEVADEIWQKSHRFFEDGVMAHRDEYTPDQIKRGIDIWYLYEPLENEEIQLVETSDGKKWWIE